MRGMSMMLSIDMDKDMKKMVMMMKRQGRRKR